MGVRDRLRKKNTNRKLRVEGLEDRRLLTTGGWWEMQELTIDPEFLAGEGTGLGGSFAMDGDTLVFGAYRSDEGGVVDSGSVHVFVRTDPAVTPLDPGDDVWVPMTSELEQEGKLIAPARVPNGLPIAATMGLRD